MSKPFNPDNFKLEKKDLILVISAIEKRWSGNFFKNGKYLLAAKSMKAGIMLAGDDVIEKVWIDFLKCVSAMQELNDMTQLGQEEGYDKGRKNIEFMRDNLLKKIESGELFNA